MDTNINKVKNYVCKSFSAESASTLNDIFEEFLQSGGETYTINPISIARNISMSIYALGEGCLSTKEKHNMIVVYEQEEKTPC